MKKLFFISTLLFTIACSAQGDAKIKATYEKNLATLKAGIAAFEKEDLEGWAAIIADDAVFHSPAYGDVDSSKAHWKEAIKFYMENWDQLKLNNAIFLPGLDAVTHQMDGSVRYYGDYTAVHKSGIATKVYFYATYDFNKDNKVVTGSEYFDVGGLMNAVKPKN